MEDKYSKVSGRDVIDGVVRNLEKNGDRYNFENSVYTFPDENEIDEVFEVSNDIIQNIEQLKQYVIKRVNVINSYEGDFIKEKSLISVFKEIYRFSSDPNFDEYEQGTIDELKDYIYDNSVYPAEKPDEIAYLDIFSKGRGR